MKSIVASIFAVSLLAAPAAMADGIGAGVHVGPIGVGAHIGGDDHRDYHSGYRHHHHGCRSWGWRHHNRYCRGYW
jgi:hypothetical protein